MPQNQPFSTAPTETTKKTPAGWVWVAGIVIVVAAVLYVTQKTAPSGENEQTNNTEEIENSAPTIVDVPATVTFSFKPTSLPAGTIFGVDWQVETSEQTFAIKTGVYWDTVSHPGTFGTDITPEIADYPNLTSAYEAGYFALPGGFEDNIKLSAGEAGNVLYMRAYVWLADKHYWSEEMAVPIKVPGTGGGS